MRQYLLTKIVGIIILVALLSLGVYWFTSSGESSILIEEQDSTQTDIGETDQPDVPEPLPTNNTALVIFHNGTGPMCIEALDFFQRYSITYVEHLTSDSDFADQLSNYRNQSGGVSEGVSSSFGYYPIIFLENRAFSGFDNTVKTDILEIINNGN